MFVVTDSKKGNCPLCMKDKEVELFVVESQLVGGYSGGCCSRHLAVLITTSKTAQKPETPRRTEGDKLPNGEAPEGWKEVSA